MVLWQLCEIRSSGVIGCHEQLIVDCIPEACGQLSLIALRTCIEDCRMSSEHCDGISIGDLKSAKF